MPFDPVATVVSAVGGIGPVAYRTSVTVPSGGLVVEQRQTRYEIRSLSSLWTLAEMVVEPTVKGSRDDIILQGLVDRVAEIVVEIPEYLLGSLQVEPLPEEAGSRAASVAFTLRYVDG